jgi:hypothetical protein
MPTRRAFLLGNQRGGRPNRFPGFDMPMSCGHAQHCQRDNALTMNGPLPFARTNYDGERRAQTVIASDQTDAKRIG